MVAAERLQPALLQAVSSAGREEGWAALSAVSYAACTIKQYVGRATPAYRRMSGSTASGLLDVGWLGAGDSRSTASKVKPVPCGGISAFGNIKRELRVSNDGRPSEFGRVRRFNEMGCR